VHHITEHHRELSSCRVGQRRCSQKRCTLRGWLFLGRRWRDYCLCAGSFASPHETATVLIDHRIRKENFAFQVFQVGIIEIKSALESAIGHASLAFQEGNDLVEDVVECMAFYPWSASTNAHGSSALAPELLARQPCTLGHGLKLGPDNLRVEPTTQPTVGPRDD